MKVLSSKQLLLEESMLEFLKEYYSYISHITNLSNESDVDLSYFKDHIRVETLTSEKSPGVLLGCAHKLFELIPQISSSIRQQYRLRSDHSQTNHAQASLKDAYDMIQRQREIQISILSWSPPQDSDPTFVLCGKIYQQALLIYNSSTILQPLNQSSEMEFILIRRGIDHVIALLHNLPVDAPISATIVWPLAFLGTLASDPHHREVIHARLRAIWDILGLGNVKKTIGFLERYWADNNPLKTSFDTRACRYLEVPLKKYGLYISFV